MHIHIIAVGKIKEKFLREGIAEYEKRLRPYVKLTTIEINEEKRAGNLTPADQKRIVDAEGIRILGSIPHDSFVIVLDIKGVHWSSETLAENLRQYEIAGRNTLSFIIGGDLGLSDTVISRSNVRLSLSLMTFTHQMIRQILLEQLYRACKINHNEPYHK
ncbi:MAG: 23S rRNA (pseudouridine(1915)-N(3))-methyltransferase RlmH [Methanoregula sp.]|nr:23S rRNA (pseudouridine(1915)-N(3))-methyltransferase RlmH [Methanoregula sp.]